ncbi:Disease resistance protein RPP13 [Dichanthelium oligosanthes]|uniref:Disease resistance protein RPP13 n=1 Tax=Dichanthelium oligosanthes TaxID=888268 RepID=A0A1E5W9S8_9POAL|nr:Disease resistance protein RPP13 [Dichanthelium oligosanthes]
MAETAITTVLAKVAELVAWEAAVLLEVGDDVRLLRDKLEWLHTFIRDADRRRRLRDDEFVAVWVRQTRDVAFEAEDALDDFLHRAGRSRSRSRGRGAAAAPGCAGGAVGWWPGCAGQVALRHDLSGRIRQIKKRLDQISDNRAAFNIEHKPAPAWAASCSSATTLAAWDDLEEYTVGLDKYSDMLKEQLLDDDVTARAVVSISGETSIGKTTLARKVYQSPEVRNHFEIRTWTALPHKGRAADVLRGIHRQMTSQLPRAPSKQVAEDVCDGARACGTGMDISNQLYKSMTGRRYLVVVDGSIAVTDWNSLRASLPDEDNGSRVLLITDPAGLEAAGNAGHTYEPIVLTRLSPENTYEVFRRRVFGRGDCPGRYKSRYYQNVFRITRGLPLSIVVLAGVLRWKELPAEWDEVMTQLAPAREQHKGINDRRIMSLAFDDLPHHLKSCFLYLAAMRESTPVDAQRLVRLWVAEGFVRPRRGSTMEEVGQGYLKELISRCMVQLVDKGEFDAVQTVVVHDRLHAFAQDEAQEASFIESHDSTDVLAPATVRRLAVLNSTTDRYIQLSNALPKLRSIICDFVEGRNRSSKCIQCSDLGFLHASKFLRVIDIQGLELKKLPNEIGSMIHIRYLGLQCGELEKLPSTIGNLVNLQSLILYGYSRHVLEVTATFWRIPTLRHVIAPFALPSKALGDLHSLQTLRGVHPRGWGGGNNPLGKVANLRSLELNELTTEHAGALEAALESLDLLVHLALRGDSLPASVFSVPSLRQLQSLKLWGPVDAPEGPNGAEDVRYIRPNLTRLKMWNTMVTQRFVNMLAELPNLAELDLMYDSYDGDLLTFEETGFQRLHRLKLGLPTLEEWTVSADSMPELATLTLCRCAKMRMLPKALAGMRELEEVVLYSMPDMVGRIDSEGEDHHKVKHVPVIQTIY